MDSQIVVVLIAALVGPFLLSWLNNRQAIARENRANKRQDEVAARVADAAEQAASAAKLLVESNKGVADELARSTTATTGQLEKISAVGLATHKIVNSQKTVLLRSLAMMARARAADHPGDATLEEVARSTENDLAENVKENADPATKIDSG